MKHYFLNLNTIVLAITLGLLNKQIYVLDILKPTVQPTTTHIIDNETKWADYGTGVNTYNCTSTSSEDIACRIYADPKYTHDDGAGLVLNTPGDTPSGEFQLFIVETTGLLSGGTQYYKILAVASNDPNDHGTGFSFVNAVK